MIFECKTCGSQVASKRTIPTWVESQYDADKLLIDCYREIRQLQDQQAMEDNSSDAILTKIHSYLLKRGYKVV